MSGSQSATPGCIFSSRYSQAKHEVRSRRSNMIIAPREHNFKSSFFCRRRTPPLHLPLTRLSSHLPTQPTSSSHNSTIATLQSHARFPKITTANMSPSYTMSSHLCKQIASSWRQTRHGSPDPTSPTLQPAAAYFPSPSPSPSPSREKRSMDSDRSDSPIMTRSSSVTSWRSAGK
ncbi:hypothetical protein BN1708_011430 [Verticillium longisporum]|uniref:Uncharacterized protein n=1 Tax=Verticillium longisporum TaxID=100787 RepID=A0A0G4KZU7_VERLO|nr:hypothetical protein BN1708_011430 [Verticillium longisporum]